tara:strand:+ start:518 stop:697 length:180 start_codon:yes stop_codon:yes gene_type:complete
VIGGTINNTIPEQREVEDKYEIILKLFPPSENFGANEFAMVSIATAKIIVYCNEPILVI